MNDPHVVSLTYHLTPSDEVRYVDPPALAFETRFFRGELAQDVLVLEPKDHYPTVDLARGPADRFVRSWEVDAALLGRGPLAFEYVTASVVDRNPPPPGTVVRLEAELSAGFGLADVNSAHVARRSYPEPPANFEYTADVDVLWARLKAYERGEESLLSMAYFCLTWVERMGGSRAAASSLIHVDKEVLDKLGELTSTRGDAQTARKASRSRALQELSAQERTWIVACLRALVRQVGQQPGATGRGLSVADLPAL